MPTFRAWDVVKLPFPYTDRPTRQRRPALVIAAGGGLADAGLLWVAMITSAENRRWPGDVEIGALDRAGLPAPSVVRPTKIASIDARDAEKLGVLDDPTERRAVAAQIETLLTDLISAVE
jgi:mRNA interferase MazF